MINNNVTQVRYTRQGKDLLRVLPGTANASLVQLSGAPDIDVKQVRDLLGYANVESVYRLARKGSKAGGLDAYIYAPLVSDDGAYHWQLKTGSGYGNMAVKFIRTEVEAWKDRNPIRETERIEVTAAEQAEILERAEQFKGENGRVSRVKLYEDLSSGGWSKDKKTYAKMKQTLDDAGIPPIHQVKVIRANVRRKMVQ
jgi:hypothetical protein